MPDPTSMNLGLFPLSLVLLPGERSPLHIFEPRYRALVADCTLGATPFVISLATDEGVARTGCTAHVDAVIRRFADGRMNIVVAGGERVEILEQTHGELYITARVAPIADTGAAAGPTLAESVNQKFVSLAEAIAGAEHTPEVPDGVPLSYAIAGAMELDALPKQRLLETRDETERLEQLGVLLDAALAGVNRQEVAAERAATNGKVHLQ